MVMGEDCWSSRRVVVVGKTFGDYLVVARLPMNFAQKIPSNDIYFDFFDRKNVRGFCQEKKMLKLVHQTLWRYFFRFVFCVLMITGFSTILSGKTMHFMTWLKHVNRFHSLSIPTSMSCPATFRPLLTTNLFKP